jgi:glycosyltransferase involved in cell wall biosynthesis
MMRRAARVVALWPGGRDGIIELYGVSPERIDVIPNARSADEFRPATTEERGAARARLGLPADAHVIAFIGSLSTEKRPGLAIAAMEHLPGATLLVVGDGPLRHDLTAQAQSSAPDRIRFLGALPSLTDVYAATDLVVSTSATEGMSGVLIEAGLSGVPVCVTDVGATPWMFNNGLRGRLLTSAPSPDELANEMRGIVGDAISGSIELPRFGWSHVVPQWVGVLKSVSTASSPHVASGV